MSSPKPVSLRNLRQQLMHLCDVLEELRHAGAEIAVIAPCACTETKDGGTIVTLIKAEIGVALDYNARLEIMRHTAKESGE